MNLRTPPHWVDNPVIIKGSWWSFFKHPYFAQITFEVGPNGLPVYTSDGGLRSFGPKPFKVFDYPWPHNSTHINLSIRHEIGHMWGIFPHCLSNTKWCVMAEESMFGCKDGSIIGKIKMLLHQVSNNPDGKFCLACQSYLYSKGAII